MSQSSTSLTGSCVDQHQDIVAYFRSRGALGGGMQAHVHPCMMCVRGSGRGHVHIPEQVHIDQELTPMGNT